MSSEHDDDAAGRDVPDLMDDAALEAKARQRRFGRNRAPKTVTAETPEDAIEMLMAEVTMLREENASLKASQHLTSGIGGAIERVRALPGQRSSGDHEDEAIQALADAYVLRESLAELCAEMERALASVRAQLDQLAYMAAPQDGAPVDPLTEEQGGAPVIEISAKQREVLP